MFDSVLNSAKDKIFKVLEGIDEPVYFLSLLSIEHLPLPYKKFFRAELSRQIYEFKLLLSNLFNFDFRHPQFLQNYNQFLENLDKIVRLDSQALTDLVFEAVKLRLYFLLQPRKILLDFVFKNSLHKIKNEILLDLDYFADYSFLVEGLKEKILERKFQSVSRFEFQLLITQIDNHYFLNSTISEIIQVFAPMFEFFNPESFENGDSKIPSLALYYFFNDKEFTSIANIFLTEFEKNKASGFNKEELQEILSNLDSKVSEEPEETFSKLNLKCFSFGNFSQEIFILPGFATKNDLTVDFTNYNGRGITSDKENIMQKDKHKEIIEVLKNLDEDQKNSPSEIVSQQESISENKLLLKETENLEIQSLRSENLPQEEEFDTLDINTSEKEQSKVYGNDSIEISNSTTDYELEKYKEIENETVEVPLNNSALETKIEQFKTEENFPISRFKSISEFISDEMRSKFIEELFYSMEEEYLNLIQKVDNSNSLEKALQEVEFFYKEFGIFEGAPIAEQFKEIVRRKFGTTIQ